MENFNTRLVAEVERNPFHNAASLKGAVNFPGHEPTVRNRLRGANLRQQRAIPREVHKEEHIEERLGLAVGNADRNWKKVYFFLTKSPFLLQRKNTLLYMALLSPDTPLTAIRARSGRVSVSCWGGFFVVEWAQSIEFAGNSTSRNMNGCWNGC